MVTGRVTEIRRLINTKSGNPRYRVRFWPDDYTGSRILYTEPDTAGAASFGSLPVDAQVVLAINDNNRLTGWQHHNQEGAQ